MSSLVFTISEGLQNNTYECVVCFDHVGRKDEVWSCATCYKVFHLQCIRAWALKSQKKGVVGWLAISLWFSPFAMDTPAFRSLRKQSIHWIDEALSDPLLTSWKCCFVKQSTPPLD